MKSIVIISGHPDLQGSVANATILNEVATALPQAEIRYLDTLYPDYRFDIAAEQRALLKADIIVWQFPFSWYSVPGLMKLWIDEVFVHGFAHGSTRQLAGKKLVISFTTGAPESAYSHDGGFNHTLSDYLPQFLTTAALCGMALQDPIYTTGVSYSARADEKSLQAQRDAAKAHAARLVDMIQTLAV